MSGQSEDYSSEEDSFSLQLQVQSTQAKTNCTASQHLVTNLEYKLKPYKKKTKFLRARIDTCANVNLMPISVYKLLYKDPDCQNLAPSNKSNVKTYNTEKIQIVGSCDLFVLHPNTKCLQEVTFQVTSHEGIVIISCATSLLLGLVQPYRDLDVIPDKGSLICSKGDLPVKQKYMKKAIYKLSNNVNSSIVSKVEETKVIQCMNKEVQTRSKQQQCQAPVFNDKKSQADENSNIWLKTPVKDMQSNGPVIQHKISKKHMPQEDDKNCKATISCKKQNKCGYKDSESQSAVKYVCSEKNCQENIRPKKPRSHMQSMTNNTDVQLPKPAVSYEYRRLCSDKLSIYKMLQVSSETNV